MSTTIWKVWQSTRLDSSKADPFLCCEIDFETREEVSNKLQCGKSCSTDSIPQEYCKDGTVLLWEQYRAAFNALIRGQQATTHVHLWNSGFCSENLRCS